MSFPICTSAAAWWSGDGSSAAGASTKENNKKPPRLCVAALHTAHCTAMRCCPIRCEEGTVGSCCHVAPTSSVARVRATHCGSLWSTPLTAEASHASRTALRCLPVAPRPQCSRTHAPLIALCI